MDRAESNDRTEGGLIVIRADASPAIGTGHVMRSLALAQSWCDSDKPVRRATYLMSSTTAAIDDRLKYAGMATARLASPLGSAEEIKETIRFAHETNAKWVVLDGYHFSPEMQRTLRGACLRVLCIDDNADARSYDADMVLNHNFHAHPELYPHRGADTHLLMGPAYALLRAEFAQARFERRTTDVARKLLVTLGGSDPVNATQMVMEALRDFPIEGLTVVVVIGGSNPRRADIEQMAAGIGGHIRVVHDAPNMAELMAWADLAVGTASVTTLEMARMGLPAVLMVLAENQRLIAEHLQEHGLARYLGWHHEVNPTVIHEAILALALDSRARAEISTRLQALVDGCGAQRVVTEMSKAA